MYATALLFFVVTSPAPAQTQAFEGVLSFAIRGANSKDKPLATQKILTAKVGVRSEVETTDPLTGAPIRSVSLMPSAEPNMMYVMSAATKKYLSVDLNEMDQLAQKIPGVYTVTVLGTEKIAGLACTHLGVLGIPGHDAELWVTREIDVAASVNALLLHGFAVVPPRLQTGMKDAGAEGLIVRLDLLQRSADQHTVLELSKVDKRSQPAALFKIPPQYSKASDPSALIDSATSKKAEEEMLQHMSPEQREATKRLMQEKKQAEGKKK